VVELVGMKYRPNRYTSTENAISLFDRFVQQWVAPALHDMMFGHPRNDAELVRRAIRGIKDQHSIDLKDGPFAYAVFSEHLDPGRDYPDGYRYELETAVFGTATQAHNAALALHKRTPGRHFVIGEIRPPQ